MAQRYWTIHENMGYAGTDSEEEIDVLDRLNITEKELAEMSDSDVEKELCNMAWEDATQKIDVWVEPREA